MKIWKRIEPTTTQKISYRTVVTKTYKMGNGEVAEFGTIWPEGQQFSMVVAVTADHQVVLARQFRVGPEMIMDELPGGYVDDGETLEAAARRELLEETGYTAGTLTYLGKQYKDAYMNGTWHCYIATDCVQAAKKPVHHEAEEQIEVILVSIDELFAIAREGRMTDGACVFMAEETLLDLKRRG